MASDIILNPSMISKDANVQGDVDLIVDDCIVDIKTTRESHLRPDDYYQILVYYMVATKCGTTPEMKTDVNSVGIYFSRHGWLFKIPIHYVCIGDIQETTDRFLHEAKG